MEKLRPTYDLDAIKLAIGLIETLTKTTSALRDATALGFDRGAIAETVLGIERQMFFKSMTILTDHGVWQDVTHVRARGLALYMKFQADAVTELRVMSFEGIDHRVKEKGFPEP